MGRAWAWVVGVWAVAGGPAPAAGPVVAVLDPDKSYRVALLEADLLADPGLTLVERAQVERLLKEQELQAAFGPQGVGQRVRLGAVLKADVLVLVRRARAAKEPTLEVVVSETAGGLRLLARPAAVTSDAAADAKALVGLVREGVRKHAEQVKVVVAAPPFVSHDLTYEADHLRDAYAKLAEDAALGRPGAVVVELAEAEAVARELALAAPGAGVRRPPATLLLGEYRHEGRGADRTVKLKLWAERGGKPVGDPVDRTVRPDEAAAVVRGFAARLLDGLAPPAAGAAAADPKAEARQLAARSRDYRRVGNWAEALALAEAALLLDAGQPEVRAEAAESLGHLISAAPALFTPLRNTPEVATRIIRLNRRGLDHLAALLTGPPLPPPPPSAYPLDYRAAIAVRGLAVEFPKPVPPELADVVAEAMADEREAVLRLLTPPPGSHAVGAALVRRVFPQMPPKQRYAELERIVRALPATGTGRWVWGYLASATAPWEDPAPELTACLDRLAADGGDAVRDGVAQYRKELANLKAAKAAALAPKPADPPPAAAGGVRFRPLTYTLTAADGTPQPPPAPNGIFPVGPRTDVVVGYYGVYVMKQPGQLRPLYERAAGEGQVNATVFDGKYVWVVMGHTSKPDWLVVADPEAGRAWEVTGADGLPQPPAEDAARHGHQTLNVVALGPGRVCVAGTFGPTWLGVAAFDPAKQRAAVRVFHEAKEAADLTDRDQWKKTTVAFTPRNLLPVRGEPGPGGAPACRVLVVRGHPPAGYGTGTYAIHESPLLVDPDRGTVAVLGGALKDRWEAPTPPVAPTGDTYLVRYADGKAQLHRARYPDAAWELVTDAIPSGNPYPATKVVPYQGRLHVVRVDMEPTPGGGSKPSPVHQWWTLNPDGTGVRRVADVPWVWRLGPSAHYGLVATLSVNNQWVPHAVEFGEPAPDPLARSDDPPPGPPATQAKPADPPDKPKLPNHLRLPQPVDKEFPLPQDPKRRDEVRAARLKFARDGTVGAFDKHGATTAAWAGPARAALAEYAARVARPEYRAPSPDDQRFIDAIAAAVAAGATADPLIRYLKARFLNYHEAGQAWDEPDPGTAAADFRAVAAALPGMKYSPLITAHVAWNTSVGLRQLQGGPTGVTAAEVAAARAQFWTAFTAAARDDSREARSGLFWLAESVIDDAQWGPGGRAAGWRDVDAALAPAGAKWARAAIEGSFLVRHAWDARGTGFADTVTPEGRKLMAERLARARVRLTEAWDLDPTIGEPAAALIEVGMGEGSGRDEMETWFRRAMTADPDCRYACGAKFGWLQPQWHGSTLDRSTFAYQCFRTQNWEAGLPLLLQTSNEGDDLTIPENARKYGASEFHWGNFHFVWQEYLKWAPDDRAALTRHARICALAGRHADAAPLFRAIGDKPWPGVFTSKAEFERLRSEKDGPGPAK